MSEPEAAAEAPAKSKNMVIPIVLGCAVLGAAVGAFVVAPRLVPTAAAAEAPADGEEGHGDAEEGEEGKTGDGKAAGKVFRIDNLIVNPAGSQGQRFLMATVAFEVSEADEATLRAREIQVRDDVVGVLAAQPLDSLIAPHSRDALKARLVEVARRRLAPKAKVTVYLPQFVIQ